MRRYQRLLPYAGRQWRWLVAIAGLTVASSVAVALQPWPLKLLIDYAVSGLAMPTAVSGALNWFGPAATPGALVLWAGLSSVAVFGVTSLLELGLAWSWAVAGQRMVRDLAHDVFERLQRLSFRYHQRHPVGDSLDRLTTDTWCVYKMTDGLLIAPVQKAITLVTLGAVAWRMNRELALYSLLAAPLMAWASLRFGSPLKERARTAREARARLVSFVHQTLSSIPVVQAFATESRNWDRFHDLADDAVAVSQRSALLTGCYGLVTGLITVMGTAVIIFAGGQQVLAGTLTLGSFMVFLAYLRTLQGAAESLLTLYGTLKPLEASIDRVVEVLAAETEESKDHPVPLTLCARPKGHVRFDEVTFGYEPGRPVVQDISFEVQPGETIALVGATGAGKTTLTSLIPRFYDPWSGRIALDGHDVRDFGLAELRAQIALVFQDAFLLPLSVADNIAYGRPAATRDEIVRAAQAANADGFVRQLPEGYDTVIGERGATLSGGERQRLAIARAMLKDTPVLILDEPTSALDTQTEALVMEAIEKLMAGRTTFIIAHRLSTVRYANRIIVLEQGRIAEVGSPAELVDRGGAYARYVALQSGRAKHPTEVAA